VVTKQNEPFQKKLKKKREGREREPDHRGVNNRLKSFFHLSKKGSIIKNQGGRGEQRIRARE